MAKSTHRLFSLYLPLYNLDYDVIIGNTMSDAIDAASKIFPKIDFDSAIKGSTSAFACSLVHEDGSPLYLIMLDMSIKNPKDLLMIVSHECVHLSWYMIDTLGIEVDAHNHEAQAYIQGYLFNQVKKCLEKHIKNRKLKIEL